MQQILRAYGKSVYWSNCYQQPTHIPSRQRRNNAIPTAVRIFFLSSWKKSQQPTRLPPLKLCRFEKFSDGGKSNGTTLCSVRTTNATFPKNKADPPYWEITCRLLKSIERWDGLSPHTSSKVKKTPKKQNVANLQTWSLQHDSNQIKWEQKIWR